MSSPRVEPTCLSFRFGGLSPMNCLDDSVAADHDERLGEDLQLPAHRCVKHSAEKGAFAGWRR